jgi:hypothetical protein
MTGSIRTYTLADHVDLVNPIAQVIAAAFGGAGATGGIDWGVALGGPASLEGWSPSYAACARVCAVLMGMPRRSGPNATNKTITIANVPTTVAIAMP